MANKDNPIGRWDLLVNGLLGLGIGYLEKKHGLNGLGDRMAPFIQQGIKETPYLRTAKVPKELMMIGQMLFKKEG